MKNTVPFFEYYTPNTGKIMIDLAYMRKHFKFVASSEDGHDAIDNEMKRRSLAYSDFRTVLEFDDIVIQQQGQYGLYFLICEAGVTELRCDEHNARMIRNVGEKSLSFSLVPNGFGARFNIGLEGDEETSNLRMKQVWGMDVAEEGEGQTAFALIGGEDRKLLVFGSWENNHDEVACKALKEYDEEAEAAELKYGRAFGYAQLMKDKALKYGTTIEEMKKHWRCVIKFKP